jgi:FixJ family two-component response regulator
MKRGSLSEKVISPQAFVAVVDDDPRIRESLESLIQSVGVRVQVFSRAADFLNGDFLSATSCLVTDVWMPGMDGLDLQHRVQLERPELPVIFITAHHDEMAEQRAFAQGASFFFYKPFDADELLRAMKSALRGPAGNNETDL